ncbi:MAG: response regulator [Pseudomonadota bacterium]
MKRLLLPIEQYAGLFIGTLGLLVALAWFSGTTLLAQVLPSSAAMGLNTPMLFMAAGFCCVAGARGRKRLAYRGATVFLIALPALVLVEHLFQASLGIDFVRAAAAPTPDQPHPGRVAPNTALAFLLAGLSFLLFGLAGHARWRRPVLLVLAGSVLLIGVTALAGHVLGLEMLYKLASYNAMVAPTAFCMSLLGLALVAQNRRQPHQAALAASHNAQRIIMRSVAVVSLVALASGAAGYAVMRDSYEQSVSSKMLLTATTSASSLANTLALNLWFPRTIASRPRLRLAFEALQHQRQDKAAIDRLEEIANSFIGTGVSGVRFFSPDGERYGTVGTLVHDKSAARYHVLHTGDDEAWLFWRDGFLLYTETLVRAHDKVVGKIATEQHLPVFDNLVSEIRKSSDSSDLLICTLDGKDAYCPASRFYKEPFRVPMYKADGSVNLPINHALLGESGVAIARDLRGIPVFAAYAPLKDTGLGLVVKHNVDTMYTPLKERANVLLAVLVALVGVGTFTLAVQVRPLLGQLVREQERTRVILENSNDAFVALDADGTITDWNVQAERTFGWPADQALGRRLADLIVPPAQQPAYEAGFAGAAGGVVMNSCLELTALCRDGRLIPIELSVASFRSGAGFVATAFMRDITERVRLSAEVAARAVELEEERDRAQAANRAKSEFVANMSHELRTPMNAVLGMTYLLGHTDLKAEQRKYIEMIRSSGQSLLGIMNDILDFSKVEAGRMDLVVTHFTLADVLGAVATIMSVNAGDKDLELAIGVDPDVPACFEGDPLRLQQVLVNLAGNAIKFTEAGEVSVQVDLVKRVGDIATLAMRVRDTGIGMDAGQLARLFLPFTQGDSSTTRRFGGTGLGLTISKRLAELMGGAITVHSAPGQGSTFCVMLDLPVVAPLEEARRHPDLGKLRLLIVDDHATSRACLSRAARALHWEADMVDSDAAAIARLRAESAQGRHYDLVLLDSQMPEMDGLQTLRSLRALQHAPRLPVILMVNAYGRGRLMGTPMAQQADAIVSKPITASSLADTVHESLAQRERPAGAQRYSAPAQEPVRLDGVRLLLVEDNELNQLVARSILERLGASVECAGNGALAVARLEAEPKRYDLVLMDVQMPVMDGYAATRQIRDRLHLDIPVLAMTAGVTESEQREYTAAGMDDLIAKPIDIEQLVATVQRHVPGLRPSAAAVVVPPAQALPVLNLAPLVAIARGNPEHLAAIARMVQRMADAGTRDFDLSVQAWREGRSIEAARLLHTMRGGVGSLGAKRFCKVSLELEAAIGASDVELADALFVQAGAEVEAVLANAQAWLDDYAGALKGA